MTKNPNIQIQKAADRGNIGFKKRERVGDFKPNAGEKAGEICRRSQQKLQNSMVLLHYSNDIKTLPNIDYHIT